MGLTGAGTRSDIGAGGVDVDARCYRPLKTPLSKMPVVVEQKSFSAASTRSTRRQLLELDITSAFRRIALDIFV
jgi:hypothetical protein